MPIIATEPPARVVVAPSIYEVTGATFYNLDATAGRQVGIAYYTADFGPGGEVEAHERWTRTVALDDIPSGPALYALIKRVLHDALIATGAIPDGHNVLSQAEQEALDSLGGHLLATAQP